jgi:hypothetical protein
MSVADRSVDSFEFAMRMRAYIQLLIEHLSDARRTLSRNRHFYTFANPQGRRALRISRHLQSLARDIVTASRSGGPIRVERIEENGQVRVLLELEKLKARRTAVLSVDEFKLLLRHEDVREALKQAA